MIQSEGKILVKTLKQSEAVGKKLFEAGLAEGRDLIGAALPCYLTWADDKSWGNVNIHEATHRGSWTEVKTHTLADFKLTPEGEPLPKFKDGDRVVCDEALTAYIRAGKFDHPRVSVLNPPLNDLVYNSGKVTGHGVNLYMGFRGKVTHDLETIGYILHAPTFGNLKPGDPNPFVAGEDVKINGSNGTVEEAETGPRIYVDHGRSGHWYGWSPDNVKYPREDINKVMPVTRPTPQSQPEQPKGLTMEDIEEGGKYVVRDGMIPHEDYGKYMVMPYMAEMKGEIIEISEIFDEAPDPYFLVLGDEEGCKWTPEMLSHRVERTEQPKYEFGDKVKVGRLKTPHYFASRIPGRIFVYSENNFRAIKEGISLDPMCVPESEVSDWPEPEPVTINIPNDGKIVVNTDRIEITTFPGRATVLSFGYADEVTAAVAKMRAQ